jgi:pyruvate/2-oxoglutarate dehydrogenase complex dihydrolipoamide acyltransferase (E2) component
MTQIKVPEDLWEDDSTGVVSTWLFDEGDVVELGWAVAEVMNEKVSFQILAPASGRLRIKLPVESEITLGEDIGSISAS